MKPPAAEALSLSSIVVEMMITDGHEAELDASGKGFVAYGPGIDLRDYFARADRALAQLGLAPR